MESPSGLFLFSRMGVYIQPCPALPKMNHNNNDNNVVHIWYISPTHVFMTNRIGLCETCFCERKANGLKCPFISLMWSMFKGLYVVLTKSKFTSRTLAFDLTVQITRYLEFQGEERIHMCIFPLCIVVGDSGSCQRSQCSDLLWHGNIADGPVVSGCEDVLNSI